MNHPSQKLSANLRGRFVFLSASFPSEDRAPEFFQTADPDEISHAIVAVARAVLSSNGRLVFGGHPSVSPLVLLIANEYYGAPINEAGKTEKARILVYQSAVFGSEIAPATRELFRLGHAHMITTQILNNERPIFTANRTLDPKSVERSLQHMRERMVHESNPVAAFFIGGMEGIRDEARICSSSANNCYCFFLGGPGGAARAEGGVYHGRLPLLFQDLAGELQASYSYPSLAQTIVNRLTDNI